MKSLKSLLFWFALLGSLSLTSLQGASKKPNPEVDDLFGQPKIFQIKIEIPSASLAALQKDPRKYIRGVIRDSSRTYSDVGIRLKGNGSFQPGDKRPALALKFNEFVSGVRFHGHSKVFLNNSHQDPTYICEALGGELFRSAGVPAPRTTYAHLELNGRDLGLYVLAEAVNKEFLSKHFVRTKGNLYEGSKADVTEKLEKDSGDESKDQKDVKALAAAAKEPDLAARLKKLNATLDVQRFISFAATEVFAWHHSGYTMSQDNYRLYNDPGTNQLIFIPHSYEELFGKPKGPLFPEWKGVVAKALLETPEGKSSYRDRMTKLLGTSFKADAINNKISEYARVVKQELGRDPTQAQAFEAAVAQLRERVTKRVAFIEEELKKAN
jgi:spore coat protein H